MYIVKYNGAMVHRLWWKLAKNILLQVLQTHPERGATAFPSLLSVRLVRQRSSHATVISSAAVQAYSYNKPSYTCCGHILQLHSRYTLMLPFSILNKTV